MKTIGVDDELHRYIASHTLYIGESASDILQRMLRFSAASQLATPVSRAAPTLAPVPTVEMKLTNPAKDKVYVMYGLLLSNKYAEQKCVANRLMLVLTTPYPLDSKAFAEVTESLHSRARIYFVEDVRALLKSGNQARPEQIPGAPWWAITNTNTGRKCSMIEYIMQLI